MILVLPLQSFEIQNIRTKYVSIVGDNFKTSIVWNRSSTILLTKVQGVTRSILHGYECSGYIRVIGYLYGVISPN